MSIKTLLLTSIWLLVTPAVHADEYVQIGEPVALSMPGEFLMAPKWSPQGEQIAASGRSYNHLYLIDFPSGESTQLSDDFSAGYGFAWSHDGTRIAARLSHYVNRRRTNSLVSIRIADGSMQTLIQERPYMPGRPVWSDGDNQLYFSFSDNLETYDLQGSRQTERTSALYSVSDGELVYYPADASEGKILFKDQDRVTSYAVSPDQAFIAYSTSGQNLWMLDTQSRDRVSIGKGLTPSWSPDSQWITFMLTEDDGHTMLNSDIFIMSRDGTQMTNITNTPQRLEMHPDWSPDGSWIVYDTEVEGHLFIQQIVWR